MLFDIQPDSAVPIYEQIVSQIIYGIAAGDLPPGSTIPSVRELAEKLVVNPNTVSRAFQELERRGAVVSRRGIGMAVSEDGPTVCQQQRQEILRGRIRQMLREATLALPEKDIRQLVEEELTKVNGQPNGHMEKQ